MGWVVFFVIAALIGWALWGDKIRNAFAGAFR